MSKANLSTEGKMEPNRLGRIAASVFLLLTLLLLPGNARAGTSPQAPHGPLSLTQDANNAWWVENDFYRLDLSGGTAFYLKGGTGELDWRQFSRPWLGGELNTADRISAAYWFYSVPDNPYQIDSSHFAVNVLEDSATMARVQVVSGGVVRSTGRDDIVSATMTFWSDRPEIQVDLSLQYLNASSPTAMVNYFFAAPGGDQSNDFFAWAGGAPLAFPYDGWRHLYYNDFAPSADGWIYVTMFDSAARQGLALVSRLDQAATKCTDICYGLSEIQGFPYGWEPHMTVNLAPSGPATFYIYPYTVGEVNPVAPIESFVQSLGQLRDIGTIHAYPENDYVNLQGCPLGQPYALSIYDSLGGTLVYSDSGLPSPTDWDPSVGWVEFGLADFDLVAGQYIVVSDGRNEKSLEVTPPGTIDIHLLHDTAEGIMRPGSVVDVYLHESGIRRVTTADAQGLWSVDFSVPGPNPESPSSAVADLLPGVYGTLFERDSDGDRTGYPWSTPALEPRVRYILADSQLGGVIDYYRAHPEDPYSVEAVSRWDAGVRVTNPDSFERKIVGAWQVVYAGTDITIDGMDVLLSTDPQTGSITGWVTDQATGDPVTGGEICVDDPSSGNNLACVPVQPDGSYHVFRLPDGDYHVHSESPDGYAKQVYLGTFNWSEYTPVPVTAPLGTPNIDFSLVPGGTISGTITDAQGQPVPRLYVWVEQLPGYATWHARTDSSGDYTVTGLLPGSYLVSTQGTPTNAPTYYTRTLWFYQADPVLVTARQDTPGIDITMLPSDLRPGGSLIARLAANNVSAFYFPPGVELTLVVDDDWVPENGILYTQSGIALSDPEDPSIGYFDFDLPGYQLKAGDHITVSGGGLIKTLIAANLQITGIDFEDDVVSGSVEPADVAQVLFRVGPGMTAQRTVSPDASGNWIIEFANQGNPYDLKPGDGGILGAQDLDGDWTTDEWGGNTAPDDVVVQGPADPQPVGTSVQVSASFSDPDVGDTHTATWNWGDGTSASGSVAGLTATASHVYSAAGVYTVTVTITDAAGASASGTSPFLVVYDPNGGFVTGGGWINSPAGAYATDPTLAGKATFGFVSKYQKGANIPTGNTEFQFKVANLNFSSTAYDWLVIAGARAQYKGTGTINGSGSYAFMLTAIDGQVNGGGGVDKFRIKIWDKSTDSLIYDNLLGASDGADPTTALSGGSIVIHK